MASGFYIYLKKKKENVKKFRKVAKISLSAYGVLMVSFLLFTVQDIANAAPLANSELGMGFIAAAISTGLATIGAGYAVGAVGSSALEPFQKIRIFLVKPLYLWDWKKVLLFTG